MKTIKFNKGFVPSAILSVIIIAFGIVGFFLKGVNLGLDFKPGAIEEVRIAEPVASITYNGAAGITVELSSGQMDVIISGNGATNETRSYNFNEVKTVSELAAELEKIDDIHVKVIDGSYDTRKLFLNSAVTNQLSTTNLYI